LEQEIREVIKHDEDAVLIVDLGRADRFGTRIARVGAQALAEPPGPVVL